MMRKTQGYRLATFLIISLLELFFILNHVPVRTGLDRFLQFQDKESRIDIFLENVKRDEIIKKMKHPALTKQKSSSNEKISTYIMTSYM